MNKTFSYTHCEFGVATRDVTPPVGIYARSWGAATHDVAEGVDLVATNPSRKVVFTDAGWSSSVARWAHNPEVAGSNPAPATKNRA